MLKILGVIYLFMFSVMVNAGSLNCPNSTDYCEIYGTKVDALYINAGGTVLIGLPFVSGWLTLGNITDNDIVKTMYSMALAAKTTADDKVWVRWNKTSLNVSIVSLNWH